MRRLHNTMNENRSQRINERLQKLRKQKLDDKWGGCKYHENRSQRINVEVASIINENRSQIRNGQVTNYKKTEARVQMGRLQIS